MPTSVLAVYSPTNTGKIERHLKPLADNVETTVVCLDEGDSFEGLRYRLVPSFGVRFVGLGLLFIVALHELLRREYDGVVSFSLFPYGCIALAVGRLGGLPVHLGVIGMDLDVHARARYGVVVAALLRRFDVVSVPGTTHRRQLLTLGLPAERTAILSNAIDASRFTPDEGTDERYDFCWVGRFGTEKDPLLFVRALASLEAEGASFEAVMLGDGPLAAEVGDAIDTLGLDDRIDRPGWVDDPLPYYRQSQVFVLTSRRDALPLTLVEAMATGLAAVVTRVGNVTDIAEDGHNAIVLDDPGPDELSAALSRVLNHAALRNRLASNAEAVRERYSYAAAARDWKGILTQMGVQGRSTDTAIARPDVVRR